MTATLPTQTTSAPARRPELPLIYDCPEEAWEAYGGIGLGEFGDMYRHELENAGRELIRKPLIDAWRKRGYSVRLLDRASSDKLSSDPAVDPPNETYWEVWEEAADAVHSDELLAFTDLTGDYNAWRDED